MGEGTATFVLIVSIEATSSPAASTVPAGFTSAKATSPLRCWTRSVTPTRTRSPSSRAQTPSGV